LGKQRKARFEEDKASMKTLRIGLLAALVLSLAVVGYLAAPREPPDGRGRPPDQPIIEIPSPEELQMFFMARSIFSTLNTGLALALLIIYVEIYLKTRAQFTVGLIIFATTLLLYAVTSNPLLARALFFAPSRYAIGLFTGLPELFTTTALVVLLYLSLK